MRRFMDDEFLLPTRAARRLYHGYAEGMPILDFHCHLPVRQIAEDAVFPTLTAAWLGGDHYKWRAMRANGVPERLITGDASDEEKFSAWAAVVPATIGNPLYHWTHLELSRYFAVTGTPLSPATAEQIYAHCSQLLSRDGFSARALLVRMNVRTVCTTDDPADSLEHHEKLGADASFPVTVVPTFRADPLLAVENPARFNEWVDRLGSAAGIPLRGWDDMIEALRIRHDAFHALGCRASDHGLEEPYSEECSPADAARIWSALRSGTAPGSAEARMVKSALLAEMARMDAEKGWVQQLHLGALRDVNSRYLSMLGANTGFDTIGDFPLARPLARFLNRLDSEGALPRTILYCIDPADNAQVAAMIGSFPQENVPGKMQFGPAWWFNDQRRGMEDHLSMLSSLGLLSRFVGMTTDSRSFLSFPRHEYFRRVLCGMLGRGMQAGELPADFALVGGMVKDICFNNASRLFSIPMKQAPGA
jgi:glucuronate isomerase